MIRSPSRTSYRSSLVRVYDPFMSDVDIRLRILYNKEKPDHSFEAPPEKSAILLLSNRE